MNAAVTLSFHGPRMLFPYGGSMHDLFYLTDTSEVAMAQDLIRDFGDDAGFEAAERADHSRTVGNYLHFCRWRQIERLIILLGREAPVGTIH